ncbi:hypothetical protein [Endozoicomonas atrinae]
MKKKAAEPLINIGSAAFLYDLNQFVLGLELNSKEEVYTCSK